MISKKICLLGSFAVGKTSLVKRFVEGQFSERYLTTIGVKIDKKELLVADQSLKFVIWDLEGRDEFTELRASYLRGAAGYFLVADCTRPDTLKVALELHRQVGDVLGDRPFVFLLTKTDLQEERRLGTDEVNALREKGWLVLETSAKTGHNVELAFEQLGKQLLVHDGHSVYG